MLFFCWNCFFFSERGVFFLCFFCSNRLGGLHLFLIKDELWKLIFTPLLVVDWSVISVMCGLWKAVAIKSDTCEHVTTLIHTFWGVWRWRNDITQFMSGVKELALFEKYVANNSIDLSGSIEPVSSPACPGGGFRYMLSHVWSEIPSIVELG